MWTVPLAPPSDPTVVSEPHSTKGTIEATDPFVQKAATAVQCWSVAEKSATAIQASKSFRLKGEHDKVMDSHLRGGVLCASVSYMSHIG